MNTEAIIKAAFATVGTVQLLKNFISIKHNKLWAIPTIVFAVIYSLPFVPSWVMDATLVTSGATIFYDTIFKAFEKMFTRGNDE